MAYIASTRVPGNVFFAGTLAQLTTSRIEKTLRMPTGTITIAGLVVSNASGKIGDLHEGNPPAAVNDQVRREVRSLLTQGGGDPLTMRVFVMRALVAAAKRAGVTKQA